MDIRYLTEYYQNYDEDGRLLRRYGSVEFLTTVKYIDRYLKKGMSILEVGAGTGRYSLHYAKNGFHVTSADLIDHNLEILRSHITPEMDIETYRCNACDLSAFGNDQFDLTLVLGPLYHLFGMEDKKRAVSEALRVTKPGGKVYIAFIMNDAVILDWGLVSGNLAKGLESGLISPAFHCQSSPELLFEMTTVQEIRELMSGFPIRELHLVASDGMVNHFREAIEQVDDELFEAWLQYHFATCERPDLIGYSNHSLYIGQKL